MGNYLFTQYNEVCDNLDYDEKMSDRETNNKNIYYWFGYTDNDVEVYELMECSD